MASCTVLQVAIRGLDSWFNSIFNNLPAVLQPTDDVVVVSPFCSLQPFQNSPRKGPEADAVPSWQIHMGIDSRCNVPKLEVGH